MAYGTVEFESLYAERSRNGVAPPKAQRGSGYPMIGMGHLYDWPQIEVDDAERVPLSEREAELARVQPGDLLFARRSLKWSGAGVCVMVPPTPELTVFESSIIRVRLNPDRAHAPFLSYFFRAGRGRRAIESIIEQTAVAGIRASDLARLRIAIPDLADQRAIASVLGVLDGKVQSNARLARAARDVLMRVPPHDGGSAPLDSIAIFRNGGALTKHATGTGRPILRIKELKAGVTSDTPRTDHDVRTDHEVGAGDLLFSWSGTLLTQRWSGEDSVLNQHVFRVDPAKGFPKWFVEAWIERHLDEFQAIAADKATTMGHIQRRHLTESYVAVPDGEEMRKLRSSYDAVDAQRMVALRESGTLTAIRDALLPKLVSGQLRVPLSGDPEEQVGAAVEALGA